jgi:hypothetical protein
MNPPENVAGESGPELQALEQGTTSEAALSFYDSLPPVTVEEMIGAWQGSEIPTGHAFDGLLKAFGWHGKRFDSVDCAHPLVFDAPGHGLISVNTALLPVGLLVRWPVVFHHPLVAGAFRLTRPALRTSKPKARLRMMEYRGVITATMSYDDLPIHDSFRSAGPDVLIGAMDLRGLNQPFMFALRRESTQ